MIYKNNEFIITTSTDNNLLVIKVNGQKIDGHDKNTIEGLLKATIGIDYKSIEWNKPNKGTGIIYV